MKPQLFTFIMLCTFFNFFRCSAQQNNFKSLDNESFAKEIKTSTYQIIDVRTPAEFNSGHIPGAINIDLNSPDFAEQIHKINVETPLALYCRSGKRSKSAAVKLTKLGYSGIELNTGIMKWNGTIVQ